MAGFRQQGDFKPPGIEVLWSPFTRMESLASVLRSAGLTHHASLFEEEELTATILRTMGPGALERNLLELGLSSAEANKLASALAQPAAAEPSQPAAAAPSQAASEPITKPPRPSEPMVIGVDHGLCNRLRAVLSYRLVALAEGRPLVAIWRQDAQCNGDFLECFAPLPGVRFVKEAPHYRPSWVNHAHPSIKGTAAEVEGYKVLLPAIPIRSTIVQRIRGRTAFVAAHIRRTDMTLFGRLPPGTTDAEVEAFLDAHAAHRVYVATDCGETYARFTSGRYASRCMPTEREGWRPGALRQTSLREAAVDLYVCAAAAHFCGSRGSSFSDVIESLRLAQGIEPRWRTIAIEGLREEGEGRRSGGSGPIAVDPRAAP